MRRATLVTVVVFFACKSREVSMIATASVSATESATPVAVAAASEALTASASQAPEPRMVVAAASNIGVIGHGAGTAAGAGENGHGSNVPSSGPVSRIRQGVVNVVGSLPSEVIQRIVRQNFGRFKLCHTNALQTDPKLTGQVVTHFVIDRSGAVATNERDSHTTMPNADVVTCVVRGFGNLSFPQPENGTVDVTYAIVLEPSS